MKWIGIVGTRSRDSMGDYSFLKAEVMQVYEDGDKIVSGGCPAGGDRFAEMLAKHEQIPIMIYYAKWNKHGKAAGFIRNGDIVDQADILFAVVDPNRDGGTEDTIKKFCFSVGYTEEEAIKEGVLILV